MDDTPPEHVGGELSPGSLSSEPSEVYEWYKQFRWAFLTLALIQNVLASGIIYGWSALVVVLGKERVFADSCPLGLSGCEDQRRKLHLVFTLSQSANLLGSLITGILLDCFGPKVCSVLSLSGVGTGLLLFPSALKHNALVFAAAILIGFWGPGVQVSLFHFSNLFPESTTTVAASISGFFQTGFLVFLMYKITYGNHGVSISLLFYSHGLVILSFAFCSLVLWPMKPLSRGYSKIKHLSAALLSDDERDDPTFCFSHISESVKRLSAPIKTPEFILLALWMAISVYWANYYIGTVGDQLSQSFGSEISGEFVNIFNTLLLVGTASIFFFGRFADWSGFPWSLILTIVCGVCYASLSAIPNKHIQIATFVMYSFFRTFLFSLVFAYVGAEFGYDDFGALTGILFLISSVISLSQYSLVRAFEAQYWKLNIVSAVTLGLTLVFPVYLRLRPAQRLVKKKSVLVVV